MAETLFGKGVEQHPADQNFLKKIKVKSKEEFKERILLGIKEINEKPVIHKWKNFSFLRKFLTSLLI